MNWVEPFCLVLAEEDNIRFNSGLWLEHFKTEVLQPSQKNHIDKIKILIWNLFGQRFGDFWAVNYNNSSDKLFSTVILFFVVEIRAKELYT